MPTYEYFCKIAGINTTSYTKNETLFLDISLFMLLIDELITNVEHTIKERRMSYGGLIYILVNDLIRSNDYTIQGIANYADLPEELIYDISIGNNDNPSIEASRKIIELHKSARPTLYKTMMKKIAEKYLQKKQL